MPDSRETAVSVVHKDCWDTLRSFTDARIALGRAGTSMPTAANLEFQLAHAKARDAVHLPLDKSALFTGLQGLGLAVLELESRVRNRREYLLRPDLGRRLDHDSVARLQALAPAPSDLAIVIADGLSTSAIARQAVSFLQHFLPMAESDGLCLAPVVFVNQGRVAIGDEIGQLLQSRLVAVLIGERPGLSSPDSMGIYLTHSPRVGLTDESRNCISNIRPEGLAPRDAAGTLRYLVDSALKKGLTGVQLKDERELSSCPSRELADTQG